MSISHIILILIIVLIVVVYFYNNSGDYGWHAGMVYVKSDIDGKSYLVRNNNDKMKAANILATVRNNIFAVTNYMNNGLLNPDERYKKNKPYITQLNEKIQNVVIRESSDNSVYTSYTVNKGETIVFCIRSKLISRANELHDLNLIMYVALHEISHVACPEYNHTPLFKEIFKFICEEAIKMGIYKKIDFDTEPKEYCGMNITDSVV